MTVENLEIYYESKLTSTKSKRLIGDLLASINDWPIMIVDIEDFEQQVSKYIGADVSKESIVLILNKNDFLKEAWYAESLTGLLELFAFENKRKSLKEILENLNKELLKQNE